MSSRPFVCTPADLEAVIDITRAIADTVRDLTELKGGVASGELYAHLMAAGMSMGQYNAVLDALRDAKIVSISNHWIKFTGRTVEQ